MDIRGIKALFLRCNSIFSIGIFPTSSSLAMGQPPYAFRAPSNSGNLHDTQLRAFSSHLSGSENEPQFLMQEISAKQNQTSIECFPGWNAYCVRQGKLMNPLGKQACPSKGQFCQHSTHLHKGLPNAIDKYITISFSESMAMFCIRFTNSKDFSMVEFVFLNWKVSDIEKG